MSHLHIWEEKIKAKRTKTDFRKFVKEICSWSVLNLYRNNGKICRYPNTGRVKILDNVEAQNAGEYFLDYDFGKWFFENYKILLEKVPHQFLLDFWDNENAEYVDCAFGVKNAYLSFVIGFWVENIAYSAFCYVNLTNIYNSLFIVNNSSNIYWSAGVDTSHNIFYSRYINTSANIWFSTNLMGCQECIFCNDLENQQYCFQNKQYTKEEYMQIKERILKKKDKYMENYTFISKNEPLSRLSENINGKFNTRCHNVENGYWINNTNDSRNVINAWGDNIKHFFDCFDVWVDSEEFYGVSDSGNSCNNLFLSTQIDQSSHLYHCFFLKNCSFCLWCIGLKNKSYCILNKQYTREEWFELADKIFAQMERGGILWDFFPWNLNPFYFNDTMAYLIDDTFTKEEVEKDWYLWRDEHINVDIPEWAQIIQSTQLNDYQWYDAQWKWNIDPQILQKVIQDPQGNYYRIIKMEYDFLMKYGLPLPEVHWLERIRLGFQF